MTPSYTTIFEAIKNAGVLLGIITGIFAILANWPRYSRHTKKSLKMKKLT